jgi:hypothetical protein
MAKTLKKQPTGDAPVAAIRKMAEYLCDAERHHYEEMREAGDNVRDHIFLSARRAARWLAKLEGRAA